MEIQPVSTSEMDHTLVGKNIEMIFEYIYPDGTHFLEWFEGNAIYLPKS